MSLGWASLPAFLLAVCVLVTVHEFGHFWVARRLGFRVLRFSVGFGRPLLRRVGRDGTEFVLALVPLGGYVKMLDEREGAVAAADLPGAFTRRPHWQRICVLLAGPACNILFAVLVLAAIFVVSGITEVRPLVGAVSPGTPAALAGLRSGDEIIAIDGAPVAGQRDVWLGVLDVAGGTRPIEFEVRGLDGAERRLHLPMDDPATRRRLTEPNGLLAALGFRFREPPVPAVLGEVEPGGPAALAGLRPGDRILAVNGEATDTFLDLVALVRARAGERITVNYRRGAVEGVAHVAVASEMQDGERIGRIRVGRAAGPVALPPEMIRHVRVGPLAALPRAAGEAWRMTALQARIVWRMLVGEASVKNLSGPLTIAELAGDSAQAGPGAFLEFLVLVSLALGFMNLLPIPILDGGQVVMQLIEWLKGSPLSERAQALGQQLGVALVMLLLGIALYNDIARQFS
ncbi:MAG: RIP metalloprotease RseP [Gammaproteobacteria bacterium]|nr:RIP metalloprotease RseP [Gammaproteobacteria bacterium]